MTTPAVPTTPHTITLQVPSVMPAPPEGYRITEYTVVTRWMVCWRYPLCDESGAECVTGALDAAERHLNEWLSMEVVATNEVGHEVVSGCPLGGDGTWSRWVIWR